MLMTKEQRCLVGGGKIARRIVQDFGTYPTGDL
jgi:hypothetical protein